MADESRKVERLEADVQFRSVITGVFITVIVVCFLSWIWCWLRPGWCWLCPKCPDCPEIICDEVTECPPASGQIVLEDSHSGVWIVVDSDFLEIDATESESDNTNKICESTSSVTRSCEWPPKSTFTSGVLLQMGKVAEEGGGFDDHYKGVRITWNAASDPDATCSGGTCVQEFPVDEFDWIDVNPDQHPCTIDPLHAYGIFGEKGHIVETGCDSAALDPPDFDPPTCLRGREIHAGLESRAAITYWAGEQYYGVFPSTGIEDVEFVFDLYDPVTADVWLDGCLLKAIPDVLEIRVLYGSASHHGGYHDPPMNGGGIKVQPGP